MATPALPNDIRSVVASALAEDVGAGDLTAALLDARKPAVAHVVTREPATLCGRAWFDEVFRQLDANVAVTWNAADGDRIAAEDVVCTLRGNCMIRCALAQNPYKDNIHQRHTPDRGDEI
jgi:nicotinate-nucleotide pyrophosphorylase (carboxylating)